MKTIKKDEIYQSLDGFLKTKGIQLSNRPYGDTVRAACGFLTEAVNLASEGVHKTRSKMDAKLDEIRASIHKATAPKKKRPVGKKKAPVKKSATAKKAASSKRPASKKTAAKRVAAPRKKKATKRS